jgi:hypothetical protein
VVKQRLCKECHEPVARGMRMEKHWQELHPAKLAAIKAWLKGVDEKMKVVERPAKEGMKGPGAQEEVR